MADEADSDWSIRMQDRIKRLPFAVKLIPALLASAAIGGFAVLAIGSAGAFDRGFGDRHSGGDHDYGLNGRSGDSGPGDLHRRGGGYGGVHGVLRWSEIGQGLADLIGIELAELKTELRGRTSLAAVAEANDVSRQTVVNHLAGLLDGKIEAASLGEDRAAAAREYLMTGIEAFVDRSRPGDAASPTDALAAAAGTDRAGLREGLRAGRTLAEIAEANDSTAQAVIDHLAAGANLDIDIALIAGRLTAEQADARRESSRTAIESYVNDGPTRRWRGGFDRWSGGHGRDKGAWSSGWRGF